MTIGELPVAARVGFYAALLGTLAAADLLFDETYAALIALALFLFVVLPLVARVFGRRRRQMPRATTRDVVAFAAALTGLTAVEVALVPDFGLGATFWIVAVVIPSLEVLGYLGRRRAREAPSSS